MTSRSPLTPTTTRTRHRPGQDEGRGGTPVGRPHVWSSWYEVEAAGCRADPSGRLALDQGERVSSLTPVLTTTTTHTGVRQRPVARVRTRVNRRTGRADISRRQLKSGRS